MTQYGLPALHGLLIWWVSTCLILFLDGLPKRTFKWSMAAATMVLAGSLYSLAVSANDTSVTGAYIAFTSGVLIWGWLEISFYMGYVTGPRTRHCHHACGGWRHFGHAIMASLHHEIAVLAACRPASFVSDAGTARTSSAPGPSSSSGGCTKALGLNVFLGVSNLNAEFLPDHLAHIRSFLRNAPR